MIILSSGSLLSQQRSIMDNLSYKLTYGNVNSKQIVPDFTNQPVTLEETLYDKNAYYGVEGLYKCKIHIII